MKNLLRLLLFLIGFLLVNNLQAHMNPRNGSPKKQTDKIDFRSDCAGAKSQIDQQINNVRARLLTGGDVWWDGDDGRYVVPKVPPGQPEVSSIFAGAVWIGGRDPAGNLKLAAQTYGRNSSEFDFFSGPLDQFSGSTNKTTCANWDKFFKVTAAEIREHIALFNRAQKGEITYTEEMIPDGVKGWPSRDNPYFEDVHKFKLPVGQGLAGFYDAGADPDGIYDPLDGDFPVIEIRGCVDYDLGQKPQYPDEMIFWIYNDNGNTHQESGAKAIQMEVQVQAFAYATNDFINDMTFQRYKLINRATETIRDCYFAMWIDPDLGCYTDDYVGCDTVRSMAYVYNQDATDGQTGCTCPQGVNTYCNDVPILGVDYFRGPRGSVPLKDSLGNPQLDPLTGDTIFVDVELGMSSFTYYNNGGVGTNPDGTEDPQTDREYYNYITGKWRDGSDFQFGGNGYNTGGRNIEYAFPSSPNCADVNNCWSMCSAQLGEGDRRTLQATGPLTLLPNKVNELIIGAVWIPEVDYPCPDITVLQRADDVAQSLFDNCFEITDGPDAPDVDWLELDRELVGILTNDTDQAISNNAFEQYAQVDLTAPGTIPEEQRTYRFEGYKVFQLVDPTVSVTELTDPTKAKLVFQSDIDNGIGKIYNWTPEDHPVAGQPAIWVPEERVLSASPDKGVKHTFRITEDQFATGTSRQLINHKKYFYMTLAYAHNNWEQFDPFAGGGQGSGQPRAYLEGRRNIKVYTAIPRPIVDRNLNSQFGEGFSITRMEGAGAGSYFLDITDETRAAIEASFTTNNFDGKIVYKNGFGPFTISVFNPLDVKNGRFELRFFDENMSNTTLDKQVRWQLINLDKPSEVIESESTIDKLNEQVLAKYGFTITVRNGLEPGNNKNNIGNSKNGAIGYQEVYANPGGPQWLLGIPDDTETRPLGIYDYVQTKPNELDYGLDPTQAYASNGPGYFVPYILLDYRARQNQVGGYLSPVWSKSGGLVRQQQKFEDLRSIDLVFTKDKSKWSRCIIVETSQPLLTQAGLVTEGGSNHFEIRSKGSVGKDDNDGNGLPDPDNDGTGMGWFPGYAIDVETGERLNIFFGEASIYRCDEPFLSLLDPCNTNIFANNKAVGADMMFNPSSQFVLTGLPQGIAGVWQYISGGFHHIYVTKQKYDGCADLRTRLAKGGSDINKARAIKDIIWTGFPFLSPAPGVSLLSYKDGLIPNDLTVKIRVDNQFTTAATTGGTRNGYPTYQFTVTGKESVAISTDDEINKALDVINVVPNPYYGFSAYENNQFSTRVKITNLPAKCVVTIYTLDGKFIRQYNRDEQGTVPTGNNRAIARNQILPDLEWDLKNSKNIPVAPGIYLIHIKAEGMGERTLKWFGITRQYDPSGL